MKVQDITGELREVTASGPLDAEVTGVAFDSRRVRPGMVYCALKGQKSDGLQFVDQALENGAVAVLSDSVATRSGVAWLKSANPRATMAEVAAIVHGRPSEKLRVMGVTGTNGKTTTAFLAHYLLKCAYRRAGLLGTVLYSDGLDESKASHTTPESPELQELLARMVDNQCGAVAMEVSSHALSQHRADAVEFDAAVFSNLTQDHLDFHGTMEAYFKAKERFFELAASQTGKTAQAIVNIDDPYGRRLASRFADRMKVVRYGLGVNADFRASNVRFDFTGTTYQLEVGERKLLVRLPLIGRFNVYNSLAALAAGVACGLNLRESVKNLETAPQVPGRLESVADRKAFRVFVDYAHTPDALENALTTLRELGPRRLITVFGCGGDRDRDKRPRMGAVADRLSDVSIITSDNPRSENPATILEDIRRGMRGTAFEIIEDRGAAIRRAIEAAGEGDIVLIAGKGHEDYQIFADRTIDFDDRKTARRFIEQRTIAPPPPPRPRGPRRPHDR